MRPSRLAAMVLVLGALLAPRAGGQVRTELAATFAVNNYLGLKYEQEPVSWNVTFPRPVEAGAVSLLRDGKFRAPCQVEVIAGTTAAVTQARVWTLVDFAASGQQVFTVRVGSGAPAVPGGDFRIDMAGGLGGGGGPKVGAISNGLLHVRVPMVDSHWAGPASALGVHGPVVALSRDGRNWVGAGYLDTPRQITKVTCARQDGPVFVGVKIGYEFEEGRRYAADVRLFAGKPYVTVVEDFNLGGAARFILNCDDWPAGAYLKAAEAPRPAWGDLADANPCGEVVTEAGQRCFARLGVWSRFDAIAGRQDTIGLKSADGKTCIGAFALRPDRWTHAAVNHVDLYARPEAPGDRRTRGQAGGADAKERLALEAWLVEGHREWALFVVDAEPPAAAGAAGQANPFFAKGPLLEGRWPLDRLNRLPLVWNADGSDVALADTAPKGKLPLAEPILQYLSGAPGTADAPGSLPSACEPVAQQLAAWAKANPALLQADQLQAAQGVNQMVGPALAAYLARDAATDFSTARCQSFTALAGALAAMKHPEARRFLLFAQEQMDQALEQCVDGDSGCWDARHGPPGPALAGLVALAQRLREQQLKDFFADARFAGMFDWWCTTCSPRDAGLGGRRVPWPGDERGLGSGGVEPPVAALQAALPELARVKNEDIQATARHVAWLLREYGAALPAGVTVMAEAPPPDELGSRYVAGCGALFRAIDKLHDDRETFVALGAGQAEGAAAGPAGGQAATQPAAQPAGRFGGRPREGDGALWCWARNEHFFGDARIELLGAGPAPALRPGRAGSGLVATITDDEYAPAFDYARVRCRPPSGPSLDLARATPPAPPPGYHRQVLLVKPDLLIVRDTLDATGPARWRMRPLQAEGAKVTPAGRAALASPRKVSGELAILYPANGVELQLGAAEGPAPRPAELTWDLPRDATAGTRGATWVFAVHDEGEAALRVTLLDDAGRVIRVTRADGREVTAFLAPEPFTFTGDGLEFAGTVGLVVKEKAGQPAVYAIRTTKLSAEGKAGAPPAPRGRKSFKPPEGW